MDHPVPLFDKEQQVIENARLALNAQGDVALSTPYRELLDEYQALLDRSRRVAELALSVQLDLEAAVAQVAQLSQVDGLTGAMNRRAFEKLLSRDWAQSQREKASLSLLVVDIDNFRAYNDIYGSLVGDDCLKSVAHALMRCLYREVDVVARMEGNTFVVLLPATEPDGARVVAERIVKEIAALEIPHLESPHGGMVTVSVGVSTVTPSPKDTPMLLVRQAQTALGEAKDMGRNAVFQHPGQVIPQNS
jgi:diguanylate cyclase (GGDEF)-like protein